MVLPESRNHQLDSQDMPRTPKLSPLGARIKARRLELGLTQVQLGGPNFTAAYISLIEAGHRHPSPEVLGHIAQRLDMHPDELITGRPAGIDVDLELQMQAARRDLDHGRVEDAQVAIAIVLKQSRQHNLTRVEARAHEISAAISEKTTGPAAALPYYQQAEELWRDQPAHLRFLTVTGISRCTHQLGDPQLAIHMLESYRRELEGSGKPHPLSLMHTYTAMIYPCFAAGLPQKAAEAARMALSLEAHVDDPDELACMHLTVARTLVFEGEYADALTSIRKAEDIFLASGWRNQLAKAQIAEAIVLSKKEDHEPAKEKLLSALEILEESPNQLDEALALNELGHVMRHLDDVHSALTYLERAKGMLEEGDIIERAFNERELGLCLGTAEPKVAERHLKRAVDLYRISGATTELATTFKALGEFYVGQGKSEKAIEALREGLEAVEERSA